MNKEPFLQVSKRRNKAGWQERLLIRFIRTDPCTDRVWCSDRGTCQNESGRCIQSNLGWSNGLGASYLADDP